MNSHPTYEELKRYHPVEKVEVEGEFTSYL